MRHLSGEGVLGSGVGVLGGAEGHERILAKTTALRNGLMSASGDYRAHFYDPRFDLPPPKVLALPPRYTHSSTIRVSNPVCAIAISSDYIDCFWRHWRVCAYMGQQISRTDWESRQPGWLYILGLFLS